MNCLKHKVKASRDFRESQEFMLQVIDLIVLSVAYELHESKDPYGKMRLDRTFSGAIGNAWQAINAYGGEYALEVLRGRCKAFGFESKVHVDELGRVQWGNSKHALKEVQE